jgi:heptosyltransferase-2
MLAERAGAQVVLIGAGEELDISEEVARHMRARPRRADGQDEPRADRGRAERADLLVTNDTGPAHVAAAVGCPVVVIFGPTNPETTRPFSRRPRSCESPPDCAPCMLRDCPIDHRCMTAITAEDVFERAAHALEARRAAEVVRERRAARGLHGSRRDDLGRGRLRQPRLALRVFPFAAEAVRALNEAGWLAVLVTNQAGVARGYFREELIGEVHGVLAAELERGGARLDAVYYCPHHPRSASRRTASTATAASRGPGFCFARARRTRPRPRALLDGRRPLQRHRAGAQRGRTLGLRADGLRPRRVGIPERRRGRNAPTSSPRTFSKRCGTIVTSDE